MAEVIIPVGYAKAIVRYTQSEGSMSWGLGLAPLSGDDADQVAAGVVSALKASGSLATASTIASGHSINRVDVYLMTSSGLTGGSSQVNVTGTASARPVPDQVAAIVQTGTALLGRQYRGRLYLPSSHIFNDDVQSGSVISGAQMAQLQGQIDTFFTTLKTQLSHQSQPALLHAPPKTGTAPAPTPITSMTLVSVLATQRRRLRR